LKLELQHLESGSRMTTAPKVAVESALTLLDDLKALADDSKNMKAVGELFRAVNLELFLRFVAVQKKTRIVNQQGGGIITLGDAKSPIEKYTGPTGRRALIGARNASSAVGCESSQTFLPDEGAISLGNVNRDDRI